VPGGSLFGDRFPAFHDVISVANLNGKEEEYEPL